MLLDLEDFRTCISHENSNCNLKKKNNRIRKIEKYLGRKKVAVKKKIICTQRKISFIILYRLF